MPTVPEDHRHMPLNCDGCEASAISGLLAVTMYELLPDSSRIGKVQLYGMRSLENGFQLEDLCHYECPGVFDLRWCPCNPCSTPNAEPDPVAEARTPRQHLRGTGEAGEMAALALADGSLQLGPDVYSSSSNGMISQCRVAEGGMVKVQEWQAHDMETWMVACDRHQEHLMYSGDDSCSFKGWDIRASAEQAFTNGKGHKAGVCCIQSHPTREFQVATGSYDENIRIWDLRNTATPLLSQQAGTGGGVWRIKFHPEEADTALVACMQNGFAVVSFKEKVTVYSYPHQKVLGYGADWVRCCGEILAATCSFYDKSFHIWRYDSDLLTN